MRKVYEKVLFQLLNILVFFTPLIFVGGTHEQFEFPKMYFVYVLGITIIWIFLLKKILLSEKIKLPSKTILAFVGVYILSSIFSTHPYTSFWGYYTRFNGGLSSILTFVGVYTVIINELNKNQLNQLIKTAGFSLIPIGLYALTQYAQITPNIWKKDPTLRAFSTLGQPNWLSAYTVVLIYYVFGQTLKAKNQISVFGWYVLFCLSFFTLWITYSVSGIIAFVLGTLLLVIIDKKTIVKNKKISVALLLTCLGISLLNPGIFKERMSDVLIDAKQILTIKRVSAAQPTKPNTNHTISDAGFIRLSLWKSSINLGTSSFKNMLVGTGPSTFAYEFQKFRPKELNYSSEWDFVFNKPHNYYIEIFTNLGLLGLVTYLILISKTKGIQNNYLIAGLVAFFVTNFFGWPSVSTTLAFWLFLSTRQIDD